MAKSLKSATFDSWEDMPLEEFKARAAKAKEAAGQFVDLLEELFPGLVTLTKEQRKALPRLRDGEHSMLRLVLDVVDLKPTLFESIASADDGMDPKVFETPLLWERIEKHRLFREIAAELEPLSEQVGDSALYIAGRFRDAVYAAYRIAKTHAETDKKVMDIVAPMIDFMRKGAVASALVRKKNKKD